MARTPNYKYLQALTPPCFPLSFPMRLFRSDSIIFTAIRGKEVKPTTAGDDATASDEEVAIAQMNFSLSFLPCICLLRLFAPQCQTVSLTPTSNHFPAQFIVIQNIQTSIFSLVHDE